MLAKELLAPENPQEDKDLERPPWESADPSVRCFYEDNENNRNLDGIIQREVEAVAQLFRDIEAFSGSVGKYKRLKKKNS